MAMFNGASVGTVEYDFTDFGMPHEKGFIPEPSRHLMAEVMEEVQDIFKRVRDEDIDPDELEEVKEALARVGEEYSKGLDVGEMTDALITPIAKLCGNVPTYEEIISEEDEKPIRVVVSWDESGGHPTHTSIDKLGFRIFLAFMGYCMEQMTSPEASGGVSPQNSTTTTTQSTRQIRRLRKQ